MPRSSIIFKEIRILQKALWEGNQLVMVFQCDIEKDWRLTISQKREDHFHAANMFISDEQLQTGGVIFIRHCVQKLMDETIIPMNRQFNYKKGKRTLLP